MRAPHFLLALPLAACGGSGGSSATQPKPVAEGSLYDQYAASHPGAAYELPAVPGTITCYGSSEPASIGAATLEMYLRRGVAPATATITEDSVALFSATGAPIRYITTMPLGGDGPIHEVNGHYEGVGFSFPDATVVAYVTELDNHSARYLNLETVTEAGLTIAAYGDTPAKSAEAGLEMLPGDDLEAWKPYLGIAAFVENDGTDSLSHPILKLGVQLQAKLEPMSAARCDEVFKHFPPPARAW